MNKNRKRFNDNLKAIRKAKNKKVMDNLIETNRFISVFCATCEKINQTKDTAFIICANALELNNEAIKKHTEIIQETGIICTNPQFIVSYETVLISKSLLEGKQEKSLIM